MKRRVFLIIMAAILSMTAAAFAVELTWNQSCVKKTSQSTTLYVDINGELTATSDLPGGTYIRTTGQSMEGKTGISYSANNSDPLYGYIDGSVIVSAAQTVTLPSGEQVVVGEALVRSRQALNLWLDMNYGVTLDGQTYTDENGEEHEIGNEAAAGDTNALGDAIWARAVSSAFVRNGADVRTVCRDDDGNETEVQVRYLGMMRSGILVNGEEQLVDTCRLAWESEAPESQMLAMVRSELSNVRFLEKPSGKIMCRVHGGLMVQVLKVGAHYTLVDINQDGMPLGYILNDSLEFYPNAPISYQTGKVSVRGKITGRFDPIAVYAEDRNGARVVGRFNVGYPLTVYARNDKWSEVDAGGYHGYILNQYITMDGEVTAAEQ